MTLPRPPITPSPDALPFWEAARRHELVLPECLRCGRVFFYPRTACPSCGSRELDWRPASGRAEVHAFTIQQRCALPGLADAVPLVTAIVELDEGPRLMTILLGVEPDPAHVRCGLQVEVDFVDVDGGWTLPVFRPREDSA
jgi:uncharacterized OB-fold protein